jgi:glutaredoxin 3
VREYLSQNNLRFKEYNISEDDNALTEMWQVSGQKTAPVVKVNDQVVVGFDRIQLEKTLQHFS